MHTPTRKLLIAVAATALCATGTPTLAHAEVRASYAYTTDSLCASDAGLGVSLSGGNLTVTLPAVDDVTIASDAAASCRNTLTSLTLINNDTPATTLSIGGSAFAQGSSVTALASTPLASVTFPSGLDTLTIADHAFYQHASSNDTSLAAIDFPSGLTALTIGTAAFEQAAQAATHSTALAAVTFPDSLTSLDIGIYAFAQYGAVHTSLASVDFPGSVGTLSIGACSFMQSAPTNALDAVTFGGAPTTLTVGDCAFEQSNGSYTLLARTTSSPASATIDATAFTQATKVWYGADATSWDTLTFTGYRTLNLHNDIDLTTVYVYPDGAAYDAVLSGADATIGASNGWKTDLSTPTRAGYTFNGWYVAADFSGDPVSTEDYVVTDAADLYASWTFSGSPGIYDDDMLCATDADLGITNDDGALTIDLAESGATGSTVTIATAAAASCRAELTSVTITNSTDQVTDLVIEFAAFRQQSQTSTTLASVAFPDNLRTLDIRTEAFLQEASGGDDALSSIHFPTDATSVTIGDYAFGQFTGEGSTALASVTLPRTVGTLTISQCGFCQQGNHTVLSTVQLPAEADHLNIGLYALAQVGYSSVELSRIVFRGAPVDLTVSSQSAFAAIVALDQPDPTLDDAVKMPFTVLARTADSPVSATFPSDAFPGAVAQWYGADDTSWDQFTFLGYRTLTLAGYDGSTDKTLYVYPDGEAYDAVLSAADATLGTPNDWTTTLPTPTRTGYTFGGWCADAECGTPLAGGAEYTVASATVTLTADWVRDEEPAPDAVDTTTTITAPASYPYSQTPTVTVTVSAATEAALAARALVEGATGTVTLTGAGPDQTVELVDGTATFTLPDSLTPGTHTLTATYSGDAGHNGSVGTADIRITKARITGITMRVIKVPQHWHWGRVLVKVSGAGTTPTGKVTVKFTKKGLPSKTHTGKLTNGSYLVTKRWLNKGTWTVKVKYSGDSRYAAYSYHKVGRIRVTR